MAFLNATDINRMSLPTFGLGKVQNWEDEKDAGIVPIPFPGEDSEETLGIDTLGIIAYLNLSGRITGDFTDIQDTISIIKSILDGKQTSWQPFYSPFLNYTYTDSGTKKNRQGNLGVNTSTNSNQLIDSGATFTTWGVRIAHVAQGSTLEGDYVKNLVTGAIARVSVVTETTLTLIDDAGSPSDIFPNSSTPYAVTVHMATKLLSFKPRWVLPGLGYLEYDLSLMQVKEE